MTVRLASLLGCALGALSLSAEARGQAFNGTPATAAGSVVYDRATPGVETITIDSASAIINWVPNVGGNPIVFLPAGRVATFINGNNTANFAVLNRIQTNVPIRFDGTVISRLQDPATGTSAAGGTIIFQGPNGIIVGPNAIFDVGNLVLTSLTVTDDGAGNFIDASGAIHFNAGDKAPNAAVVTLPGAQILANSQGSYVAFFAPVIQHGGTTRVNGSVAYVAAEAVDFRANAGLFDLVITAGSQNAIPLTHTGSTGGPASTGAGDVHRIYMVAMPKNQAITAILEGNVGFDPAVGAAIENGAIVLSAGYSVVNGEPDRFADFTAGPVPGLDASFHIRGGTITSDLFGYAVTDMLASGASTGSLAFAQDVSLFGGVLAQLFAGPGQTVTVGGNALVSAARDRTLDPAVIDLAGGTALIFADGGGSVDIAGDAIVDASARGVADPLTSIAGSGTGGIAGLLANAGGSVRVRGNTSVLATGAGGTLDFAPNRGGAGQGGTALVEGRGGGQVRLDGTLAMDASGTGSRSSGSVPIPGANGTGGDAHVAALNGGTVTVAGAATLTANGTGGDVAGGSGVTGGSGHGGTVSLFANGTVTFAGDPVLTANGAGGAGPNGGTAQGGIISLAATPLLGLPGISTLSAGNVTGTASATGAAATGNTPGEWHVAAGANSSISFASLTLTASANGPPAALPFSSLEALRGRINVAGTAALATLADIRVIGDGAGRITGGLLDLDSGRDVTISHTSRGANFTIDVTDLDIDGRNVTVAAGSATRASNRTDVAASATATVGGVMDGSQIVIAARDADVQGTGSVGSAATSLADIGATAGASVAGTVLGRAINVQGATVTVASGGTIGGAGTDTTRVTALGNAGIAGRILGRDIRIASADIDLTGAVGDSGTQNVNLVVNAGTQPATLGGGVQGPGYTLTNAEAGRIRADALRIDIPALGANPALFVRDLAFSGGGAAAGIGTLAIVTPGIARVEGNLLMSGARPGDGIALTATQRLEVVTPTGSIRVRNGAGAPGGTMTLTSNNIWVATSAIIDRLRLDPNYPGRDADLLDNGGSDVPRGYVEADGVTLNSGGTLFVQNTGAGLGTFATGLAFGGVTVGAGGLTIRPTGATPAIVTAFGRRLNPDGSFTTGYDFFVAVNFSSTASYTLASTFNTCVIATGQCPARPPANAIPGRDPTTGPTGGSAVVQLPPGADGDDPVDVSFAIEPLIEEPVTSGGESVVWQDCDRDHDGRCDEVQP